MALKVASQKGRFEPGALPAILPQFHAEYNAEKDQYIHHRVAQAFEVSQVLRLCNAADRLTIFAADLNCTAADVPYRLLTSNTGIVDTFVDCPLKVRSVFVCRRFVLFLSVADLSLFKSPSAVSHSLPVGPLPPSAFRVLMGAFCSRRMAWAPRTRLRATATRRPGRSGPTRPATGSTTSSTGPRRTTR